MAARGQRNHSTTQCSGAKDTVTAKETKDTAQAKHIGGFSTADPELAVSVVPGADNQTATITAAEPPIVAAERFMVEEPAAAARAIFELNLAMALSTVEEAGAYAELETAPVEELLEVAPAIAPAEAFTPIELAATPDLAAASSVSKRLHVSEPPWFGPLRRWPDLEGEPAVDALTVAAVEDSSAADAYTEWLPAVAPPSIELPAVLAA